MGRSARATGARLAAMICFLGSSILMFFSRQKNKYGFVAISSDWTGLMFCAIVNIAVFFYNVFVLFISSNSQLWKTVIFVDMVICGLVCSSLGVGWQTYALLDEGNRNAVYANWRPVCGLFPNFCSLVLVSVITSTIGFAFSFSLLAGCVLISVNKD